PRVSDKDRKIAGTTGAVPAHPPAAAAPFQNTNSAPAAQAGDRVVLTVSGYIVNRERIEISPRFLGVVKWIGVKKCDVVTNGQVIVRLDDAEYLARVHQAEGALAAAKVAVAKAELYCQRIQKLSENSIESKQTMDDARLQVDANRAAVVQAEGELELA